jgi:signal transduction histidine kinase
MGMANSAWRHSIEGDAINIRNTITLLRHTIQAESGGLAIAPLIEEKFALIERLASQILDKPITPPLSSEEGMEIVALNDLVSERIAQLWEDESYQLTIPKLNLQPETNVGVWISPEWLRRALDLLVDNAVEAMTESPTRQLEITTCLAGNDVEVIIRDVGKGIPPDIYPRLFQERIENSSGLGMGLLMVQAIVQTYGGDVRVKDTSPHGTTMVLSLPVAEQGSPHVEQRL